MSFMFSIRIVLKSGHILTKSVPINIYRVKPKQESELEDNEEEE